ncbi:dynamin family protein [Cetobacterium sp.]|uniref:dynamin family protein n=1 Tax=Cetobacterium sp. TaxID=2071632 RepID=UPI003EE502F4
MAQRKEKINETQEVKAMEYIGIKYNPYIYEVEILKSSYDLNKQSRTNLIIQKNKDKALHFWYKDLINAISEDFNNKSFKLIFNGRNEEYADILEEVEYLQKKGWGIISELVPLKENRNILKELEIYIKDIVKNAPTELKKELKEKKAIEEFEIAKNSEAEVSVIATMSSGKSTLLNAILGKEILPSKNEACTATICRIKDVDGLKNFRLRAETIDGKVISDWKEINSDDIKKYNEEGNKMGINLFLEGDVPGINSDEMNLILIDTPGPNNSQNTEHKEATYKFIKDTKNNPLVLYVMNATQHGTNDDANLLSEISEIVKNNGKQAEERFIFALNKIDCFDPEKESINTLIENSKEYLRRFGIENPKIFPISAEAAKLVRLRERGEELSRAQRGNLQSYEMNFLPEDDYPGIDTIKYASISEVAKEKLYKEAKEDKIKGLLHYSGITAIEIYIDRYVNKYAKTQKVKDSVNTLKKVVDDAYSEVNLLSGKTSGEIEKIIGQITSIENIVKTKGKDKIKEVKDKINNIDVSRKEYGILFNKFAQKFSKIERKFYTNKISEEKARLIIEEVSKDLENLALNIKTSTEKINKEEIRLKASEIINELKSYFYDILGEINLNSELKSVLQNKVELELPSTSHLLREGAYTVKEHAGERYVRTVSRSTWWKPWTWGDEEDIYETIYENKTYIDLSKIKEQYLDKQKTSIRQAINSNQQEMINKVEELKKESLEKLYEVEKNIESKMNELKVRAKEQENLLKKKSEFEKAMRNIIMYKNKLDEILNG